MFDGSATWVINISNAQILPVNQIQTILLFHIQDCSKGEKMFLGRFVNNPKTIEYSFQESNLHVV